MSAADIRSELRLAEADLADVRQRMDHYVDAHGKMPEDVARGFAAEMESADSKVWHYKREIGKLKAPF